MSEGLRFQPWPLRQPVLRQPLAPAPKLPESQALAATHSMTACGLQKTAQWPESALLLELASPMRPLLPLQVLRQTQESGLASVAQATEVGPEWPESLGLRLVPA